MKQQMEKKKNKDGNIDQIKNGKMRGVSYW